MKVNWVIEKTKHAFNYLRQGKLKQVLRWKWWRYRIEHKGSLKVTLQQDVRMYLYSNDKLSELIYFNDFERNERDFLNAYLRPGDIYIDVGANIGLFTIIAARLVGENGKVIAFEPARKTYQRLLENVRLNDYKNVFCIRKAISNSSEQMELIKADGGFDAWNSLGSPSAGTSFESEVIQTTTLDSFVNENGLLGQITMIKIDVEGWEKRVILGAKDLLSRRDAPVLQVEFTDCNAQAAGSSCGELYESITSLGYKCFLYDPINRTIIPEGLRSSYPYLNIIAVKDPDRLLARLKMRS